VPLVVVVSESYRTGLGFGGGPVRFAMLFIRLYQFSRSDDDPNGPALVYAQRDLTRPWRIRPSISGMRSSRMESSYRPLVESWTPGAWDAGTRWFT
jgi:hypothetical protein